MWTREDFQRLRKTHRQPPRLGKYLEPILSVWFFVGLCMSWLMQPVFLLLLYFLVFTPLGLLLKIRNSRKAPSGWIPKHESTRFEKMF